MKPRRVIERHGRYLISLKRMIDYVKSARKDVKS